MSVRLSHSLAGLISGLVFGTGLALAGMTNPEKVIGFLDLFGSWDPSLAFTMAGALLVSAIGYRFVLHKGPILAEKLHLPSASDVDTRLLAGSIIFGIGWGLAGYCPGPALTGLAGGSTEPLIFLAAMIAGSQAERLWLVRHPSPAQ